VGTCSRIVPSSGLWHWHLRLFLRSRYRPRSPSRHVTVSSLSRPDTRSPLRPAAAVALAHLLVRSPMQADGYQQQYRVDGPELLIYQILVSLKRAAASSMGSCILEDSPSTLYLKRVMTASRKRCKQLVGSNGERWSQILRGARQESRWVAHREH
jgi:hypothetical protein